MDFSADSIDSQLNQLIPTLCAITDYWNVRLESHYLTFCFCFGFDELYPSDWKILSSIVNISANDFKVYSFLNVIKYIIVNDCFVICVGTSLLYRCDTTISQGSINSLHIYPQRERRQPLLQPMSHHVHFVTM